MQHGVKIPIDQIEENPEYKERRSQWIDHTYSELKNSGNRMVRNRQESREEAHGGNWSSPSQGCQGMWSEGVVRTRDKDPGRSGPNEPRKRYTRVSVGGQGDPSCRGNTSR